MVTKIGVPHIRFSLVAFCENNAAREKNDTIPKETGSKMFVQLVLFRAIPLAIWDGSKRCYSSQTVSKTSRNFLWFFLMLRCTCQLLQT